MMQLAFETHIFIIIKFYLCEYMCIHVWLWLTLSFTQLVLIGKIYVLEIV